jgi:hypothetical protein
VTLAIALAALAAAGPASPLHFKCSIAATSGGGVVAIVSSSSVPIAADVHISLSLESTAPKTTLDPGTGYWAPVDLDTGLPYGANQPRHLRLRPHETIERVIAPSALSWARDVSAVWPSQELRNAVPNGRYILHLKIEGPGKERTRSNALAVVVDAGTLSILAKQP